MDLPANAISHYEQSVPARNYKEEAQLKQSAYKKMKPLQGWCSNVKAGVLMDLIFNHRPNTVVEVGVYGGKSLIPMAMALKYLRKGVVYGIDPWRASDSVVGFMDVNEQWWGMLDHDEIMNGYLFKLQEYNLNKQVVTIRDTSADVDPIENIDLLHIDGNHSEDSALFDVMKWVPLVRSGGVVVFDDVDWRSTDKAEMWLDENCHRVTTFHGNNVWGIWIKK